MARFSVLSHETKALFWRAPGQAQNLVDSHCCHNRREGREARGRHAADLRTTNTRRAGLDLTYA